MRVWFSRLFTGAGCIGILLIGAIYAHGAISSRMAIADFQRVINGGIMSKFQPELNLFNSVVK